jgi:hypothetical protein
MKEQVAGIEQYSALLYIFERLRKTRIPAGAHRSNCGSVILLQ